MEPSQLERNILLPPEIWCCIFDHATHVPGTLIPDIYDYAHLVGPDYNSAFRPRLREALITKRALVCVCKQWWHLATPHLYRSLYVGSTQCLIAVFRTLADSAVGKGTIVTHPLGEYTQRLDIAIRHRSAEAPFELKAIIDHLPNLTIISFGLAGNFSGRNAPSGMLSALHCIAPKLRVLDWSSPAVDLSASHMTDLIPKCTQLRVLNCPGLVWSRALEHGGIPPTLTTLRANAILSAEVTGSTFDSNPDTARHPGSIALQELILSGTSPWKELLHFYGSQLVSVHLCMYLMFGLEPKMELLPQTCPRLRRLTITCLDHFSLTHPSVSLPSITYLGLRTTYHQSTRQDFKALFTFLEVLKSKMPSLRVVQLLNEHSVCCLFRSHAKFAKRALQPFTGTASFRIEDKMGVLLTDRLSLGHL